MIKEITNKEEKINISTMILNDLPEWFGIPESTKEYIDCSADMPFWAAFKDGKAVGFIALKETSPYTAEVYVTGILKEYHRHGIGRQLFDAFYEYAKDHGYSFIQVKTVQEGHYKEYDQSCRFYKSVGFKELECFPTLWDEWNPCQIFIMALH
ncbi:MAG: GNAT family N-acetyltransferase [Lachnospiraceae bacterium]|nr:GNAT family N-acetyltransferase [Lachnospiraceae bacterium]